MLIALEPLVKEQGNLTQAGKKSVNVAVKFLHRLYHTLNAQAGEMLDPVLNYYWAEGKFEQINNANRRLGKNVNYKTIKTTIKKEVGEGQQATDLPSTVYQGVLKVLEHFRGSGEE